MARTNSTAQKFLIIAVMAGLLFSPMVSYAQYTPLAPLPCIEGNGVTCPGGSGSLNNSIDFQNYVQYAFNLIIALAAAGAVLMLVMGGLQYMTTDSWSGKTAGLDRARNALYGLLLVLTSYLILRTIDPRLVSIKSDLVTPLKITYQAGSGLDELFNQLKKDATSSNAAFKSILNQVESAKNDITVATDSIVDIKNKIVAESIKGGNDSSIPRDQIDEFCKQSSPTLLLGGNLDALCTQLKKAQSSLLASQSTVNFGIALGTMQKAVAQCAIGSSAFNTSNNLECLQNQSKTVIAIYNQYGPALSPAQNQTLSAYLGFANYAIDLNTQISKPASYNSSKMKASLEAMSANIEAYSRDSGVDQIVLQDMREQEKQLINRVATAINSLKCPPNCTK
ncbi:MAG: hypothetical protein WCV82_01735 [Candidatus Paceibacterota bacterium]